MPSSEDKDAMEGLTHHAIKDIPGEGMMIQQEQHRGRPLSPRSITQQFEQLQLLPPPPQHSIRRQGVPHQPEPQQFETQDNGSRYPQEPRKPQRRLTECPENQHYSPKWHVSEYHESRQH